MAGSFFVILGIMRLCFEILIVNFRSLEVCFCNIDKTSSLFCIMDEKVGEDDDANKTSLANLVKVLFIGNFSLMPAVVQSFSYAVIVSICID